MINLCLGRFFIFVVLLILSTAFFTSSAHAVDAGDLLIRNIKGSGTSAAGDIFSDLLKKPSRLTLPIAQSSAASLIKVAGRATTGGLALHAVITAAGWIYDELNKTYKKPRQRDLPTHPVQCQGTEFAGNTWNIGTVPWIVSVRKQLAQSATCVPQPGCTVGVEITGPQCQGMSTCTHPGKTTVYQVTGIACLTPLYPADGSGIEYDIASDKDLYDLMKTNFPMLVDMMRQASGIEGRPYDQISRPGDTAKMRWPEGVEAMKRKKQDIELQVIVDDALNHLLEGKELTPLEVETLTELDVNPDDYKNAVNKLKNGVDLTQAEKDALDKASKPSTETESGTKTETGTKTQTTTTTNTDSQGNTTITNTTTNEINIPTDCDFMPTHCAFLQWYKDHLNKPAPQQPERFYQKKEKTVETVFSDFVSRMKSASIVSSVDSFFSVSISGSCPVWALPASPPFLPSIQIDFQCSSAISSALSLVGLIVQIVAAFAAFRWAFLD